MHRKWSMKYYAGFLTIAVSLFFLFHYFPFGNKPKTSQPVSLLVNSTEKFYNSIGYYRCAKYSDQQDMEKWMYLYRPEETPCDQYFAEFAQSEMKRQQWPPPLKIPENMVGKFTLWGRIPVNSYYFAEKLNGEQIVPLSWFPSYVETFITKAKAKSTQLGYKGDTEAIYVALSDYSLSGKIGFVIGSLSPWLEAILLAHGVEHVTTVEYQPIISTHPQISYIHPLNFSLNWRQYRDKKFDFMFSFSSIEHSGLGRFGDQLDPEGDLRELRKTACLLPYGALVFVGFEVGQDTLRWNAHRVYGQWRLPLITAGYEVLDVYYKNGKVRNLPEFIRFKNESQPIIVLKNLKDRQCD